MRSHAGAWERSRINPLYLLTGLYILAICVASVGLYVRHFNFTEMFFMLRNFFFSFFNMITSAPSTIKKQCITVLPKLFVIRNDEREKGSDVITVGCTEWPVCHICVRYPTGEIHCKSLDFVESLYDEPIIRGQFFYQPREIVSLALDIGPVLIDLNAR